MAGQQMHAGVLHGLGQTPRYELFEAPVAGKGDAVLAITDLETATADFDNLLGAATRRTPQALTLISVVLAVWGLGYTLYRAYYALGGTWLLPGTLANPAEFRFINAAAVVVLAIATLLPIAMLPLWRRPRVRPLLLGVCWLVAVGCCMHAVIDIVARVLSLTGLLHIQYSMTIWASIVPRTADLQDLFFNEPWFLLEGLGFGALAWIVLGPGRSRRKFIRAALVAISALVLVGLLSLYGVVGKWIVG